MAAPVIQFKRGLFSNLPGLRAGEPGFTTDKYDLYVGVNSTSEGNKFFGSHRYWTKETSTTGSGVNLVEGTNNGENAITLKSPAALENSYTITFPGAIVNNGYLKVASDGTLSWDNTLDSESIAITGIGTVAFLQATTVNASGIVTASSFSGSGSGLSSGTVPISSLDIDGGTAASALTADDLFIIDDGAGGTNKKLTAQQLSDYVLGGSGGATFPAINVTGIATVNQFNAADAKITGIATASGFRGADFRDVDGSLVPLVGVSSLTGHTGLVTAFKFTGTGLEEYVIADEIAIIKISGVAASTYTTSQTVTASTNQTTFTFSAGYEDGFIDAYLNGVRLIPGVDFTANDNTTVVLSSQASAGDELEMVAFKSLGDIYSLNQLQVANSLTVSGVVTAGSFNGALNFTGVSTAGQVQATTVNASGIVTASSFSGSGAGLSAGTTPISTLDIDGATAATALTSDDLFIIDDGANGTNKKLTAQQLSNYVLGGSGGATFPAINVTGIGTIAQLQATTATVGAGLTVTGDADLNGNLDVDGFTELDAVNISETLSVTGVSTFTGNIDANGNLDVDGFTELDAVNISETLSVTGVSTFTGAIDANGNLDVDGFTELDAVNISETLSVTGVSTFTGNIDANGNLDVDGFTELDDANVSGTLNVVGVSTFTGAIDANGNLDVDGFTELDAVNISETLSVTGVSTFTGAIDANGNLDVDGFTELDAVNISETLSVTGVSTFTGAIDANGGANISGSATIDQLTVSGVTTSTGGFVGNLTGNSSTATALQTARNFQVTGDAASAAVSFDGTANVGLAVTLATVNSNVGQYGSQTTIPVITVNAKGLVTAVTTASVGTALTVTGDSGSEQIDLLSEALSISGGTNLNSSASSNGVTVNLDNDISLTSVVASGIITATSGFSGNLTGNVTGNVSGNLNSVGVSTISFLKATTATLGAGLTVTGATDLNGGLDVSGGETVLSSATVSDLTSGRVVLAGASGALVDSGNLTFGANGLVVTGGANVSAASTFGSDLAVGGNVVVSGDLTVNGTTTQINTVQMTVEDTLIELQMVDGSAPSSDTNKDVGVVMNYFDSSAKKAAFYWDDSAGRMVAASQVSESSGVLTASTFAGLEIGSLYVNDCAGASQVISCSGTTRSLENITIDGGSF